MEKQVPASRVLWVVGAGGLLGRAVVAEAHSAGRHAHRVAVPWADPEASVETLGRTADALLETYDEVTVAWCAGAGVVGTSAQQLDTELDVFTRALERWAEVRERHPERRLTLFLASSAGGVYAGSSGPPFTEHDEPVPLAPYGRTKLAMEQVASAVATRHDMSVLVGRIANLYGPGQSLAKAQGIISQLCQAQFEHRPLSIYVSLDTARDYLYVADAARMVLGGLDLLSREPSGTVVTKILCSGRATTLASIIAELHRLSKRRPPIVLGTSPHARFQASDLRFRSVVWPALDPLARTVLPVGMAATLRDVGSLLSDAGGRR